MSSIFLQFPLFFLFVNFHLTLCLFADILASMKKKKSKESSPKTALRQYLDLTGLTYREAAKRCGLTHQTVFIHATGKAPIGAKAALMYHRAFNLSLEKMLSDGR